MDEVDSRMDEDISEGDDVDTELAAEMIIRDSPHQSSDEDERERGAVGGESRRKKDESPRDKKADDGVATGKGQRKKDGSAQDKKPGGGVATGKIRSAHNDRNETFTASKLSLKGNAGKQ